MPPKLASLKISSSGTTLLGMSQDGTVQLWNVTKLPTTSPEYQPGSRS